MNKKIKIAIVGCGYWGSNLLRNLATHPNCQLVGICDGQPEKLAKAAAAYSHVPSFSSFAKLLKDTQPEAVVIATPPDSHCALAVEALRAGAHVLIEKPMATSSEECALILQAAEKANKSVMVDNTLLFYPPVMHLIELIRKGDLGDLLYYDSSRVSFGGFQTRANVLWDLAPHEFSILDLITKHEVPEEIVAVGAKHFGSVTESMCYLNLKYKSGLNAHINMNWAAPIKFRQMIVGGSRRMAVLDDSVINDKIRVYDKSVEISNGPAGEFSAKYHSGDVTVPVIPQREALFDMITEFVSSIFENRTPSSNGQAGARVVKILEAASKSLIHQGRPEKVVWLESVPAKPSRRAA